ncbi:YgjP-like metallopeptidase domain-containing protein [Streptomyces albidoflavus]
MTTAHELRVALVDDLDVAGYICDVKVSARRRTLGWTMKPGDRGITAHAPAGITPEVFLRAHQENRHRLAKLLDKGLSLAPTGPVAKELVPGEGFLWLGRSARLRIVDNATQPLVQNTDGHGTWLELARPAVAHGARPFIKWYCVEGTPWLREKAPHIWSRLAPNSPNKRMRMPRIVVEDIGRARWGVYHMNKHLVRIAWQTLQLPPHLVEHVLTHELTHATWPAGKPHGPEFWQAFTRARTAAREEHSELNEVGRSIWHGDITT